MHPKTSKDDRLIPEGYDVLEYSDDDLSPEVAELGCRWLARHEFNHRCGWYSWEKSYPSAVLAARVHAGLPCAPPVRSRRRVSLR